MDLYAYILSSEKDVAEYIEKYYGPVPRMRGVRFMKVEAPEPDSNNEQIDMYNSYCGQDVIYIHTRCGPCRYGFEDGNSNYVYCGGMEWEESLKDKLLNHCGDEGDSTYCDHYFKAADDDQYKQILKRLEEIRA